MITKTTVRSTLKAIGSAIAGLFAFVLLYVVAAYVLARITVHEESVADREIVLYIKTNGVHTDLVVPVRTDIKDWSKEVRFDNTVSKDTTFRYVGMGWGDKGFYLETPTWADLKASVAFKAVTGLSTTAIHATFFQTLTEDSTCKRLLVSRDQYARLVRYIDDSFQKDANGHFLFIKTNAVYGTNDAFYEATGSYSLFRTCNTWANSGLKACGQRCCLWTPFDTGIFAHYP